MSLNCRFADSSTLDAGCATTATLSGISLPEPVPTTRPGRHADPEEDWTLVRQMLHDPASTNVEDRVVAGLFCSTRSPSPRSLQSPSTTSTAPTTTPSSGSARASAPRPTVGRTRHHTADRQSLRCITSPTPVLLDVPRRNAGQHSAPDLPDRQAQPPRHHHSDKSQHRPALPRFARPASRARRPHWDQHRRRPLAGLNTQVASGRPMPPCFARPSSTLPYRAQHRGY